jgi:hypothetical protein
MVDPIFETQSGTNLTEAGGLGATFFHSYPQFSGGLAVIESNDSGPATLCSSAPTGSSSGALKYR